MRRFALPILILVCSSGCHKPANDAVAAATGGATSTRREATSPAGGGGPAPNGSSEGMTPPGGPAMGGSPDLPAGTTVASVSGSAGKVPGTCVRTGQCPTGKWIGVTPPTVDLKTDRTCGNFGTKTIQADPSHPGTLYTIFFCQGVWKSVDYGQTWTGPINTGKNGSTFTDCAGGVTVAPVNGTAPPFVYASCIRGAAIGFWASTNGGVDWTTYNVAPAMPGAGGQQFYPPLVDPYDRSHLLMVGHAWDLQFESTNGGKDWRLIHKEAGMKLPDGATGGIDFVNTGDPATTRTTWLWLASEGSNVGTWRTTNSGQSWTKVATVEHINGATSLSQPGNTKGEIYLAGTEGIQRSTDYGQHWAKIGTGARESVVVATSRFIYAMYGWAAGPGSAVDVAFEMAPVPGTGRWTKPATPAEMYQGAANGISINDGKNNIILVANYNAGLWRYIEPAN